MFNCLASILTLINSTVVSASSTVWPDMVKLRHFGEIFSNLWQFFEGSFSIWRKSEYTLAKVRSYWAHIFINVKGLLLKKLISHLVTLLSPTNMKKNLKLFCIIFLFMNFEWRKVEGCDEKFLSEAESWNYYYFGFCCCFDPVLTCF